MNPKKMAYKNLATTIIKNMEKRGFETYYCEDKDEVNKLLLNLIKKGSSIAWGGSETIKSTNILELLNTNDYILHDRSTAITNEEKEEMYKKHISSDYYLMSSNAITFSGELVNIDGNGNRVACLIHGPKNVIVVVGMNKAEKTLDCALSRVSNIAAPPNAVRLGLNTPCSTSGSCQSCFVPDCMCANIVITRMSKFKNRIKVILVGEELGY